MNTSKTSSETYKRMPKDKHKPKRMMKSQNREQMKKMKLKSHDKLKCIVKTIILLAIKKYILS